MAISHRAKALAAASLGSLVLLWLWFSFGFRAEKTSQPIAGVRLVVIVEQEEVVLAMHLLYRFGTPRTDFRMLRSILVEIPYFAHHHQVSLIT